MDHTAITFWLSIWGSATGTGLALIKGFEFYREQRAVFKADARLTTLEDIGNTIILLNKSSVPVTISYFDLVWVEQKKMLGWSVPFTRKIVRDVSPIEPAYGYDVLVLPHTTHALEFTEENHFDWGAGLKQNIYLRLWLVGRTRPIWLWITGPGK